MGEEMMSPESTDSSETNTMVPRKRFSRDPAPRVRTRTRSSSAGYRCKHMQAKRNVQRLLTQRCIILEYLDRLILQNKKVMESVEIEVAKARKHHRDCNITRSVGASVLGVGGAASLALIAAPVTSEESATLTVPILGIGVILILGAFIGDLIRSILFLRKAKELAYSDDRVKEDFISAVREFESILLELLHVDGMVLEQCEDLRAALDNDSVACRKIRRAIDNYPWSSHINEIMLKSSTSALSLTVKGLAEYYGPGAGFAASKMGLQLALRATGAAFFIVGSAYDLYDVLKSWRREHPSASELEDLASSLRKKEEELLNLRRSFAISDSLYAYDSDDDEFELLYEVTRVAGSRPKITLEGEDLEGDREGVDGDDEAD